MPTALAGLLQPAAAQVAEKQGGCCHWSSGVLKDSAASLCRGLWSLLPVLSARCSAPPSP